MSDTESKPVKGENDGEGSEHINLKVKGQVDARIFALLSARRPPPAARRPRRPPRRPPPPSRRPRARTPRLADAREPRRDPTRLAPRGRARGCRVGASPAARG